MKVTLEQYLAALYPPDTPGDVLAYVKKPFVRRITTAANLCGLAGLIRHLDAKGFDVYLTVNTLNGTSIRRRGRATRGTEQEVVSVVAMVADIDAAGKAGHNYPPQPYILDTLAAMPLAPSIVISSGKADGGIHSYWLLNTPFIIHSDEDRGHIKNTSTRWQRLLEAKLAPYDLDSTFDLVRVLRPVGTVNKKYGTTVSCLQFHPERRYSVEEIEAHLPPQEPPRPIAYTPASGADPYSVISRARAYIATIPGAVSGQGGHDVTFHVACCLILGFGLSVDDAFPILMDWNQSCQPPWSERDLLHKLQSADQRPSERGYLLHGRAHTIHQTVKVEDRQPTGENVRTLEDYRKEMVDLRVQSVMAIDGGVYLDRSPTGSGKSRADIPAVRLAGTSLTVVPTIRNSKEAEESYNREGLLAAAYPALTKEVCQNYDEATKAIGFGLSPSSCVCLGCEYRTGCVYRETMKDAEAADHRIATHKRTELSFESLAENRRYISIHEDPTNLFRPTAEIGSGLDVVSVVAQHARHLAADRGDATAQHFFWKMEEASHWLADQLACATVTTGLPMPSPAGRPNNVDSDLWRSILATDTRPSGNAVRIAKALAGGDLHGITVRVDQVFAPGCQVQTHKAILAIWQTKLPKGAAIWINDATGTQESIEEVVGHPVADRTPGGEIAQRHRVVQIPTDITQATGARRVVAVLQAVMQSFSEFRRIGIVCHRKHVPILRGTAKHGLVLDDPCRQRITKLEYFRGGENRASNHWIDECDFLIVAGTPRVPPAVVRTHLLRIDKSQAAGLECGQQGWDTQLWIGTTEDGKPCEVEGRGYANPDWGSAYRALVHAELMQTVGRGRAICENGIPVVVLTNEDLGFPIFKMKTDPGKTYDFDFRVLSAIRELNDKNATGELNDKNANIYIANLSFSVSSSAIAKKAGISLRSTIRILNRLLSRKLVVKHGKRGGWSAAAPMPLGVSTAYPVNSLEPWEPGVQPIEAKQ
jgi:hypothetical protein